MKRLLLILAAVLLLLGAMPLAAGGSSGSDDDRSGSSQEDDDSDDRDDDDDDDDDHDDDGDDDDDDDDADDDDRDDDDGHHQRRHRNRGGDDDDGSGGTANPGTGGAASGPAPNAATVQLLDKTFAPSTVRVAVGGTVTWDNGSGREHTVTGGSFDSGVMGGGQFRHTFASAGTVAYRCLIHSGMNGTVVVGDGGSGPSASGSSAPSRSSSSSGSTAAAGRSGSSGLPSLSAPVQPPVTAAAADAASVEVRDFEFAPPDVTVAAGGSVTWTLVGEAPHTVTGDGFDSGTLEAGATYTETFDAPGTVNYRCNFHPEMTGTVTVVAAAGGSAGGTGDTGGGAGAGAGGNAGNDSGAAAADASQRTGSVLANSGVTTVPLLVAAFALLLAGGMLVVRRVRRAG